MQTMQGLTNPLQVAVLDASEYPALHELRDEERRDALAESMRVNGWQGPPLVVVSDIPLSLTGVHRRAAAELAELDRIPGVELADIFEACGLDLWEIIAADEVYSGAAQWHDFSDVVNDHLPRDIANAYGLDLH